MDSLTRGFDMIKLQGGGVAELQGGKVEQTVIIRHFATLQLCNFATKPGFWLDPGAREF